MNSHVPRFGPLTATLIALTFVAFASPAMASQTDQPGEGGNPVADAGTNTETNEVAVLPPEDELTDAQKASLRHLQILTVAMFFLYGASIGSFLNVVVYRLPNGRPVWGRSACPMCKERILFKDNIPVVGWLRLRGRCRACEAKIPIRYPAVELIVGLLFVALLVIGLLPGGANLPVRTPNYYNGVVWIIWYTKWDLLGIYTFHCCLTCIVVAAALMQWDGHPVALRLAKFAAGVGFIAPLFWQHLHPVGVVVPYPSALERLQWKVPFNDPVTGWRQYFGVGVPGIVDSLAGGVAGLLVGMLVAACLGALAFPKGERETLAHKQAFCTMFGLIGMFLGWQAMVPVAIMTSCLCLLFASVGTAAGSEKLQRQTSQLAIATTVIVLLLLWRDLSVWEWAPDHTGWPLLSGIPGWPQTFEPYGSLVAGIAIACVLAAARRIVPVVKSGAVSDPVGQP